MIRQYVVGERLGYDHLDSLVEIGLETGEVDDRLTALKAANKLDYEGDTRLAPGVVATFAAQTGQSFQPNSGPVRAGLDIRKELPLDAAIRKEVAKAVGSRFGVETVILELVSADKQDFVISHPHDNTTYLPGISDAQDLFPHNTLKQKESLLPVKTDKPYLVMTRFMQNMSNFNFSMAMRGIRGR